MRGRRIPRAIIVGGIIVVSLALAAGTVILASGGSEDGDGRSPLAGMVPIGGGAAAEPGVASLLQAEPDPAVRAPFPALEAAGRVVRITAHDEPDRPVRIALPLDRRPAEGEMAVVAVASSPGGTWEPLRGEVVANGTAVTFEAPHFSWFVPLLFDLKELAGEARKQLDGLTSGMTATARQPTCTEEDTARADGWKVTSRGPDTLKWCFGLRDGRRILKVVNARRYPLLISHRGAPTLEKPRHEWFALASLSQAVTPRRTSLPPRESVTYGIDGDATIQAEFDGLAHSLHRLQYAGELAVMFLTKFGTDKKTAIRHVSNVFEATNCTGALQHLDNAGEIIERCFSDAKRLGDALGAKGVLLAAVMTTSSLFEHFRSEFNALGDLVNGRDRYVIRVDRTILPVLGVPGYLNNGHGWGEVEPEEIYNGGVPSGLVMDITWRGWGDPTAYGTGRKSIYKPNGGYYAQAVPTELRATRLATCPGSDRPTYTRLLVRHPDRPGGPMGEWFPWALTLCDWDQEPTKCGSIVFTPNTDYGVFEITAWDIGCDEARRVARAVGRGPQTPGAAAEFEAERDGFRCSGYSSDAGLASIRWTCVRETAQVTFALS